MEYPRNIDSINLECAVWYLVAVAVPLSSQPPGPPSPPPDTNFILQEDGFFILQEDGNRILLEVA
jgi:hypothetical protein